MIENKKKIKHPTWCNYDLGSDENTAGTLMGCWSFQDNHNLTEAFCSENCDEYIGEIK